MEYNETEALAAAMHGRAVVEQSRGTRKRLRRRTRPGAARRERDLRDQLERVREAKRRLRPFNARAPYYEVPRMCYTSAKELRLEYQQLWKMLKRGEGRAAV